VTALQAQPSVSSKGPLDASVVALQAGNVLADARVKSIGITPSYIFSLLPPWH
jgi:hypothetical protein